MSKLRAFDLLLRFFERLVDPGMDDRLVILEAERCQHGLHPVRAENAHQIVVERQEELGAARVALTAGAAAQLIVDAPTFVPLGADDVEAAGLQRLFLETRDLGPDFGLLGLAFRAFRQTGAFLRDAHLDVTAELNVGAAARHIGRNGDRARYAGFCDDIGFLLVEAGVQHCEKLRRLAGARRRIERLQAPPGAVKSICL